MSGGGVFAGAGFPAVALALEDHSIGAVQETVEDGGGDAGVVVEEARPVLVGLVGRDDGGTAFVALADELEEQVGAGFVEGEVADLVEGRTERVRLWTL